MAKLLIVEDEKVVAWHIQMALEKLGHSVTAVTSGREAIRAAENDRPDIVMMDIQIRGRMSGITAAEQIYSRFDLPVIYLTAHTDDATVQQALRAFPFGYLAKPLRVQELQTAIEVTLQRHQQEQSLKQAQNHLLAILTSLGDGTIATGLSGNVTFINPIAEQLTGWLQQQAIGQPITQVFDLVQADTREAIENPVLRAIQTDTLVRLPDGIMLRTRDNLERMIADSAAPLRSKDGNLMGGVLIFQAQRQLSANLTSLTETVSTIQPGQAQTSQTQINQAQTETALNEAERSTDRFTTNIDSISQALQTPVNNMRMAIEMLKRIINTLKRAEANPEIEQNKALLWQRMEQYLQILNEEWQQESDLIDQLLTGQQTDSHSTPISDLPVQDADEDDRSDFAPDDRELS